MKSRSPKPKSLAAEAYKQEADEVEFEDDATCEGMYFQNLLSILYGPPKIGKSTLAALFPGVYFLPTEPGYKALKVRKTYIPNWVTFTKFIRTMSRKPKLCKTVSLWCVDTSDNLAKFCMQWVCGRDGISYPSDAEWGKGWEAFRDEFTYWILQLANLGPGVIFVSHETEREVIDRNVKITKWSPALPKTCYTVLNNMVDIILHMRYTNKSHSARHYHETRCLFTKPSENRDAGDRTGKLPDIIKFKTEKFAVQKILDSFEAPVSKKKKKKKKERR